MKHLDLLNEFRERITQLHREVEASTAMGLLDLHRVSENLVLGLLRELYGLLHLRNLNAQEHANFPGIDLADDPARVAVQVTGSSDLEKVKDTLQTVLRHNLHHRYDRVLIYVLTAKQGSYRQASIDTICQAQIEFIADRDILDFKDLCHQAIHCTPAKLVAALEVLRTYQRGGTPAGLAVEDFDPTATPAEYVTLNLLEVTPPDTLWVADLRADLHKRGRIARAQVRQDLLELDRRAPSGYEVHSQQLLSFFPLEDGQGPFAPVIDSGTVTPLRPREYYRFSTDQERTFKSLLRLTLQQQLYQYQVQWMHEESQFVFLPRHTGEDKREEAWEGQKLSKRRVYERKPNKNDPSKTFYCKHLAFSVDFILEADRWYLALVPGWYFSYGEDYRRSRFADQLIAWVKRRETNRLVFDQFRFLSAWLQALDPKDLLAPLRERASPTLSVGSPLRFDNHPHLDDETWLPLKEDDAEDGPESTAELFQ